MQAAGAGITVVSLLDGPAESTAVAGLICSEASSLFISLNNILQPAPVSRSISAASAVTCLTVIAPVGGSIAGLESHPAAAKANSFLLRSLSFLRRRLLSQLSEG
jgi:hypothetical protein